MQGGRYGGTRVRAAVLAVLVAVAAVAVRGRSDRCAYAEDWIDVEQVWGRTVTPNEKSALSSMLGSC